MDKDQDLFISHCKSVLPNYQKHRLEAKKAYDEAYKNEPLDYKKSNAGIIAGNSYLLSQLKITHEENWRPEKKKQQANYKATGGAVDSGVKSMKPLPKGVNGIKLDW